MDMEQRFRFVIIVGKRVIFERPCGGHAASMRDLFEIALAQPEQCRPVHLRIAADIIMELRREILALGVRPCFVCLVATIDEHRFRVPIGFLARQIIAALEDQNALAGGRDALGERCASGAAADHDQIIMVSHATPPRVVL